MVPALTLLLLQAPAVALENEYVRVTRDGAPCASAAAPGCGERVIVALGDVEIRWQGGSRRLSRGDVAVFGARESHDPPVGGGFFEVAFKPDAPPVTPPAEHLPPEKNAVLHDGERFLVFEERLEPGDTRARHSHNPRVVIQLNATRLRQWPEGGPEVVRDIVPERPAFNPPVIHVVTNVGELPLRGVVIELKPRRDAP